MSCPAISTVPCEGAMMPDRHRRVVVLPAPFGPTRPSTSPGAMVKEMRSTAVKAPYCLVRFWTDIMSSEMRVMKNPPMDFCSCNGRYMLRAPGVRVAG